MPEVVELGGHTARTDVRAYLLQINKAIYPEADERLPVSVGRWIVGDAAGPLFRGHGALTPASNDAVERRGSLQATAPSKNAAIIGGGVRCHVSPVCNRPGRHRRFAGDTNPMRGAPATNLLRFFAF